MAGDISLVATISYFRANPAPNAAACAFGRRGASPHGVAVDRTFIEATRNGRPGTRKISSDTGNARSTRNIAFVDAVFDHHAFCSKPENTADVGHIVCKSISICGGTHSGGHVALVDASTDDVAVIVSTSDDAADLVVIGCSPYERRIDRTLVGALVDGRIAIHISDDTANPSASRNTALDGQIFDGGVLRRAEEANVVAAGRGLIEVYSAYSVSGTVKDALVSNIITTDRRPFRIAEIDIRGQRGARRHIARLPVGAENDIAERLQLCLGPDQIRVRRRAAARRDLGACIRHAAAYCQNTNARKCEHKHQQ